MDAQLKLPGNLTRTLLIIIPIGLLYFFGGILENEIFGTHYVQWFWGLLLICAAIYFSVRYGALPLPERLLITIAGIIVGLGVWHYELANHADTILSSTSFRAHILFMMIYFLLVFAFIFLRRQQMNALSRQLFEIAARGVNEKDAGFTHRPYPAGSAKYTRTEITAFAKFMEKQLITRSTIDSNRVVLAFSTGANGPQLADVARSSHITFAYDGTVSVQMSEADYDQYKDKLTFDQLCDAMGRVFKTFLNHFQQGENEKILAALKDARSYLPQYLIWGLLLLGFFSFFYLSMRYLF